MNTEEHFIRVINENKGLIFKVSALYTNNIQDRNDLYQEIVYQLWKSFSSFNEQSKLSTWMYRVALNTAIYYLKQAKRRIETVPIELEENRLEEENNKEEEAVHLLYDTIQMLNLLERGIILLYLEGKSHDEIASIIGITTSNVGTKISRIKVKLKTQMTHKKQQLWN